MYPHLKAIRDNLWREDGKSRVSVMVGAGFSLNAKKIESNFSGMALWNDLKNKLVKNLSHHPDIEYRGILEIGQLYVEEYSRSGLDEVLKESIPDDNYEPDKLHYALLNLPWTDIYTTNYDTLLERAKKSVYERNYQVIYDINDIPSSVQPRIVKLHGSFPANRPFIFTKKDYDEYPEKFSSFVNMVQQSIMETTFVLLGFSGDDPNFEKWTTWVSNNLGEQMPKIYMIGYGQKHRQSELRAKGITLIDFKDMYMKHDNPYSEMFSDLFEFLSYKNREEKTKWPHRGYNSYEINIENWIYNRQTYPGWIVMPDDIRRTNAKYIRISGNSAIKDISSLKDINMLDRLNEILWCYEKYYIPLDYYVHQKLKNLFNEYEDKLDNRLISLVTCLFKEARLDCNRKEFLEYKSILENFTLSMDEKHNYIHEQLLFHLSFNNIEEVEEILQEWEVGAKEVEWGIKKAVILSEIGRREEAKDMFETYIQTIRGLLAVQMDDYRLLSLESVALHNRKKIIKQVSDGNDRLRVLSYKYCDTNKEFDRVVVSVKRYENTLGTRELPGFDPGTGKVSTSMGDFMKQELLDSYAVSQIHERFSVTINDTNQYELALKNLESIYPLYSLIKRINHVTGKRIEDIFSREFVYTLSDYNLKILVEMLERTIQGDSKSNIGINIALEILSRIYFALPFDMKLNIDMQFIEYINGKKDFKLNDTRTLENVIKRIIFDKNNKEIKLFCEQLIDTDIKSQLKKHEVLYANEFFEPLLIIFMEHGQVSNIEVSEEKLSELFDKLNVIDDYSIKESALIRLTFLAASNSLPKVHLLKFITTLQALPKDRGQGVSDFIFGSVFDKIINSDIVTSENEQKIFLEKDIPVFYVNGTFSEGSAIKDYFNEMSGIFLDYIGAKTKTLPKENYYRSWLNKFYIWWDSQKEGLLRNSEEDRGIFSRSDYLIEVIRILKNNIWGSIPIAYLNKTDKLKAKQIFEEIDNARPDVSIWLIPCLIRLNIEIGHGLEDILKCLFSKETNKVKSAANSLYDFLIYIDKSEISEDSKRIKNHLINMIYYGSSTVFKIAVDSIRYTMKNAPAVFDEKDCLLIIEFADSYLQSIKKEKIPILTLDDFENLSKFVGLIAVMYNQSSKNIREKLNEWMKYIQNHRLPEVRRYMNFIDDED